MHKYMRQGGKYFVTYLYFVIAMLRISVQRLLNTTTFTKKKKKIYGNVWMQDWLNEMHFFTIATCGIFFFRFSTHFCFFLWVARIFFDEDYLNLC